MHEEYILHSMFHAEDSKIEQEEDADTWIVEKRVINLE